MKEGDTQMLVAELPRDVSALDSIELLIGRDNTQRVSARVRDANANTVEVSAGDINKGPGTYLIEWELEENGVVETIPTNGFDQLRINETLDSAS